MSDVMKVKPWGKDQGDHVLINAEDFNPDFHVPFEDAPVEETSHEKKGHAKKKGAGG